MAKKKYYVVKVGRVPGIYFDWDSCKAQVDGYKGAVYKGFATINEANDFLKGTVSYNNDTKKNDLSEGRHKKNNGVLDEEKTSDIILNDDKHFTAYVDGSYNDVEKSVGCGVIMFSFGEARKEAFAVSGNDLISMRNVAGEIKAAWWAMEYAIENNAETLDIYHDYEGVAKWCTGAWKANLPETMRYRDYYKSIEGKLKVTFHKVKGHSGNEYNEMADKLAKSACNIAD